MPEKYWGPSGELMTEEEIHDFGIQVVVKDLQKEGHEIISVETDLGREPRIVAKIQGRQAFIFDPFMTRFLNERNWLVHHSWRTYHGFLDKPNEYKTLLLRVRGLADDAVEFNELFFGFLQDWARERGVTTAEIDQVQKQFLDVWQEET